MRGSDAILCLNKVLAIQMSISSEDFGLEGISGSDAIFRLDRAIVVQKRNMNSIKFLWKREYGRIFNFLLTVWIWKKYG